MAVSIWLRTNTREWLACFESGGGYRGDALVHDPGAVLRAVFVRHRSRIPSHCAQIADWHRGYLLQYPAKPGGVAVMERPTGTGVDEIACTPASLRRDGRQAAKHTLVYRQAPGFGCAWQQ